MGLHNWANSCFQEEDTAEIVFNYHIVLISLQSIVTGYRHIMWNLKQCLGSTFLCWGIIDI